MTNVERIAELYQQIGRGMLKLDLAVRNAPSRNMKTEYQPLHERIIVVPDEAEKETSGGLIIPDKHQKRPACGRVLATGPGTAERPMQLKVDDRVLYQKNAGTPITLDGHGDVLIMREDDVLVVDKRVGNPAQAIANSVQVTTS